MALLAPAAGHLQRSRQLRAPLCGRQGFAAQCCQPISTCYLRSALLLQQTPVDRHGRCPWCCGRAFLAVLVGSLWVFHQGATWMCLFWLPPQRSNWSTAHSVTGLLIKARCPSSFVWQHCVISQSSRHGEPAMTRRPGLQVSLWRPPRGAGCVHLAGGGHCKD